MRFLNESLSLSPEKGGSGVHVKGMLAIGLYFFDLCCTPYCISNQSCIRFSKINW